MIMLPNQSMLAEKIHSYDTPTSANGDHKGASPHVLYIQHIDALMHGLGIHNIFTKSITKNLFFELIQVNKRTYCKHFSHFYVMSIIKGLFSP